MNIATTLRTTLEGLIFSRRASGRTEAMLNQVKDGDVVVVATHDQETIMRLAIDNHSLVGVSILVNPKESTIDRYHTDTNTIHYDHAYQEQTLLNYLIARENQFNMTV